MLGLQVSGITFTRGDFVKTVSVLTTKRTLVITRAFAKQEAALDEINIPHLYVDSIILRTTFRQNFIRLVLVIQTHTPLDLYLVKDSVPRYHIFKVITQPSLNFLQSSSRLKLDLITVSMVQSLVIRSKHYRSLHIMISILVSLCFLETYFHRAHKLIQTPRTVNLSL